MFLGSKITDLENKKKQHESKENKMSIQGKKNELVKKSEEKRETNEHVSPRWKKNQVPNWSSLSWGDRKK